MSRYFIIRKVECSKCKGKSKYHQKGSKGEKGLPECFKHCYTCAGTGLVNEEIPLINALKDIFGSSSL